MTKAEIAAYRDGYNEHRNIVKRELQNLLSLKAGHKNVLAAYLCKLEEEMEADHWRCIQEEFPGITRKEYEASFDETEKLIRAKYYSKNGYLKPRLVKP